MGSVGAAGNGIAGVLIHHFVETIVGVMTIGVAAAFSMERVSSLGIAMPRRRENSKKMMMKKPERRNSFILEMAPKWLMRCFTRRFYREKCHGPIDGGRVYCREGVKV